MTADTQTTFRVNEIACGDCLEFMRQLPDGCVNCVVTSPPYWGLRSYAGEQEVVWGGEAECEHEWAEETIGRVAGGGDRPPQTKWQAGPLYDQPHSSAFCLRCGAWKGGLGLEPTPDLYVEHIVQVFREVRRVLHPKGVCFLNLGDSYAGSGGAHANEVNPGISQSFRRFGGAGDTTGTDGYERSNRNGRGRGGPVADLKAKDLCMMPARVALALQADGWWLRSEITWCKLSPMPESVTDRPTSATEKVYLLTKGGDYWYDAEAVREPIAPASVKRISQPTFHEQRGGAKDYRQGTNPNRSMRQAVENFAAHNNGGRNLRNYWVLAEPVARLRPDLDAETKLWVLNQLAERGLL